MNGTTDVAFAEALLVELGDDVEYVTDEDYKPLPCAEFLYNGYLYVFGGSITEVEYIGKSHTPPPFERIPNQ